MGTAHGSFGAAWFAHVMQRLAERRPVFHSEADFQHALAWQIQSELPSAAVRLETRPIADRRVYLDIAVTVGNHRVAIELKHLTRGLNVEVDGEAFSLADQSAHDIARYDVVKDIWRVEQLLAAGLADSGYVIVLTNDSAFWRPGRKAAAADASFRIHEGQELSGTLEWGSAAGPGTTKHREAAIELTGRYVARWADYSTVAEDDAGKFRYVLVEAKPGDGAPHTTHVSALDAPQEDMAVPSKRPSSEVAATTNQGGAPSAGGTDQTARAQILDAMAALETRHGRTVFPLREIVEEVQRRGSQLAVTTIRTFITSVMCVDAPPNHPTRYPDLRRVGRGEYERIAPTTATVPAAVREVVEGWRNSGRPRQAGVAWPKAAWIETFPQDRDFLTGLPDRLARDDVRAACPHASRGDTTARQTLLAAMAWGYGKVGYGRWWTQAILRNPSAASKLAAAVAVVASEGPVAGYRALAGEYRLDRLGPSFGTKFLYFCPQRSGQRPALILDRLLRHWFGAHTDLRIDSGQWSTQSYARYLQHMWQWAEALGEPADVLEECIFMEQSRLVGNQWA